MHCIHSVPTMYNNEHHLELELIMLLLIFVCSFRLFHPSWHSCCSSSYTKIPASIIIHSINNQKYILLNPLHSINCYLTLFRHPNPLFISDAMVRVPNFCA